ncbi:MAG: hypothetical protein ACRDJE_27310 [Dehalococcoidia bacterium]
MATAVTRGLITAATTIGGIAAGASLDRSIVQLPAWHRVGPVLWGVYSRQADLRSGLVWYPPLGIGSLLVNLMAAVAVHRDRSVPRAAAAPVYVAAVLTMAHLLVTSQAGPNILRVRRRGEEPNGLRDALDGFTRWQAARASLDALLFAANLWSLRSVSQAS